jgi:hypothetical protein
MDKLDELMNQVLPWEMNNAGDTKLYYFRSPHGIKYTVYFSETMVNFETFLENMQPIAHFDSFNLPEETREQLENIYKINYDSLETTGDLVAFGFMSQEGDALTGSGDAASVFSTVSAITKDFVDKYKPNLLCCGSYGPNSPEPSRYKLYHTILIHLKRKFGFEFYEILNPDTNTVAYFIMP